jgi:hypothetical protein
MTFEQGQQIIMYLEDILIGIGLLSGLIITTTFWSFLKGATK